MNYDLLNDVSSLTNIKPKIIDKMESIAEYCICDYIDNLKLEDEDVMSVNIGIGTLNIAYIDNEIKYQFIPSESLEKNIVRTINGENVLKHSVECSLRNRVYNTYKDLF